MCPTYPGQALLDFSMSDAWSDEELVLFLAERKATDSLPRNVVVGMDFSLLHPQNSSGEIWYLNWPADQQTWDNGENAIRKAGNGYWKIIDVLSIPISTAIVGVKTRLEFYEGEEPSGKRTDLVMHEYQVQQNDGAIVQQDYKSLCTIFSREDKMINAEDQQVSMSINLPNDRLGFYLQYLGELEHNDAVNSQVVSDQTLSSSRGQEESKISTAADSKVFADALTKSEYIELNDLLSPEASPSTSEEHSSRPPEEYINVDAFLTDILNEPDITVEEHKKNCKFSIAPAKLDHVVIAPPELGTVDKYDMEKWVPDGDRHEHSSSCSPSSHVNSCAQRKRSISKLRKIGEKYLCLGSF